jgi:hypothetical protein
MRAILILTLVAAGATVPAYPASLRLGALADNQSGTSFDADLRFSPSEWWSVGAGVGKSESNLLGSEFSGTSLRLSSDVNLGGFNATVAMQQWKDTDQIESTSVRAELGWMTASGFAVSALLDDRQMSVDYTTVTQTGQTRQGEVDFNSNGLGLDLSWFGEQWNAGARFLDYSHGRSIERVQVILNAPTTARFPRLTSLGDSIVTRAAAAPERELSITIGREFKRSSLQGDWLSQRDALTQVDVNSLSATHGFRFNQHVEMSTTLGFSGGGANDTTTYGGLALTLRN